MVNILGHTVDIPFVQNPWTNSNQGSVPILQNPFNGKANPFDVNSMGNAGFFPSVVSKPQSTAPPPPPGPHNQEVPSGSYSSSVSSSGGSSASSYDPAALAYYDDQIGQVNSALGRLGNQRNIGNQNINSQYNAALNKLLGQNAAAERDYGTSRQNTIDDNVTARAKVDDTVAKQSAGLRRLLGNSSSAALFAAPLAVARQGNTQLGDIQTAYSRNLGSLDTANEDRKRAFQDNQTDLNNQAQIQRNSLQASLAEKEAQLLDQMSQLQIQKAQANGQTYNAARAATQGNNDRVNALLAQIDSLGLNPSIAAKGDLKFSAPDLAQYQTSDINVTPGATPTQAAAGQFYNLLGLDGDQRKQQLF